MRLLHTLWLIDGSTYLIIFALKMRLFLFPHRENHLESLAQVSKPSRGIKGVVAISVIFMLVPSCSNAEIQSSMRQHVNRASHFCQQRGIAIAVTSGHLPDADTFGIAGKCCC